MDLWTHHHHWRNAQLAYGLHAYLLNTGTEKPGTQFVTKLKSSSVYMLLCFWLGSHLLPGSYFSSLFHPVSSCLLTSHSSTPSGSSFYLSLSFLNISLQHCLFTISYFLRDFTTPFSTYALTPLHFHLFLVGNMCKACFPPLFPCKDKKCFCSPF